MLDAIVENEKNVDVDFIAIKEDLIKRAWTSVYDMHKKQKEEQIVGGDIFKYENFELVPYVILTADYYNSGELKNWGYKTVGIFIKSPEDFVKIFEKMRTVKNAKVQKAIVTKSICYKNEDCLTLNQFEIYLEQVFNALVREIESLRNGECVNSFEVMKKDLSEKALSVDSFIDAFEEYKNKK